MKDQSIKSIVASTDIQTLKKQVQLQEAGISAGFPVTRRQREWLLEAKRRLASV